jgi:hypothetical protein
MPLPLLKLPEAFGLKTSKAWYPHYFNTESHEYVGPEPDILYYGASEISEAQRKVFLEWYEGQKGKRFDNNRVLESYHQNNATVLHQTCQIFRRVFMAIRNIEVFLEVITIASA